MMNAGSGPRRLWRLCSLSNLARYATFAAAFAALERCHHEEDVIGSRCGRDFGRFRSLAWWSAHLSRTRRLSVLVGLCRCPGWTADPPCYWTTQRFWDGHAGAFATRASAADRASVSVISVTARLERKNPGPKIEKKRDRDTARLPHIEGKQRVAGEAAPLPVPGVDVEHPVDDARAGAVDGAAMCRNAIDRGIVMRGVDLP